MDHKEIVRQLICKGLNRDQALAALAIIVEERQIADRQGYTRGFNDGYEKAQKDNQ